MNNNTNNTNETKNGRVGYGKAVHQLSVRGYAICGSGNVGVGPRRRSNVTETTDPVTCKKCLAKIAEAEADAAAEVETTSSPIVTNSLTTGEVETTGKIILIRRLT